MPGSTVSATMAPEGEQDYGLQHDTVLQQIKQEIKLSRDYVQTKRDTFRSRLKLYNNQRKQRDKVGDTSIYNVMNTMLAIYYSDEMQVAFHGREIGDTSAATNVENTAKFDHDEMGMEIVNYMTQWDRLFFGVGIRQCSEWNQRTQTPIVRGLDTFSWLPDPRGGMDMKFYRWHGFEVEYTRGEMDENPAFFNLEWLPKKQSERGSEQNITRADLREAQGLDDVEHKEVGSDDNETFYMVDHFTILKCADGKRRKFLVTVDDAVTGIFRCEEIQPVTPEEKDCPELVPFPLALNFFSPSRHDPFGVSVPDLIEDKQRAKSIFKNLRIASRKAQIYPMYLYNRDKILNRRDLDFAFNKFIAVRGDVGDNVVSPLNKAPSHQAEIINDEQSLDADIEISTGMNKNAQGVLSEQQRTASEVNQTQANADLRSLLGSKINAWGERRLWRLWYRLYRQNFAEDKIIRIQSALGSQYATITRKQFITKRDPDVYIGSKLEIEQKRFRERVAFSAIAPMLLGDPTKPASSRAFIRRHLLRLHNVPAEQIAIMEPDTPDETKAKMENELLAKNMNDPEIDVERDDHLSHIVVHSQAEPTAATLAHIQAHRIAYYESGQYQELKQREMAAVAPRQQQMNAASGQAGNLNASVNNQQAQPGGVAPAQAGI